MVADREMIPGVTFGIATREKKLNLQKIQRFFFNPPPTMEIKELFCCVSRF